MLEKRCLFRRFIVRQTMSKSGANHRASRENSRASNPAAPTRPQPQRLAHFEPPARSSMIGLAEAGENSSATHHSAPTRAQLQSLAHLEPRARSPMIGLAEADEVKG